VAECRVRTDELEAAEILFWGLAEKDPDGPLAARALLRIADLKRKGARWAEASEIYTQVRDNYDDRSQASALNGLGMIGYHETRYEQALALFEDAWRLQPDAAGADLAGYMSGWCLYMLGRDEAARSRFRSFVDAYPRSEWAGDALFWLGEYDYNRYAYPSAETTFITLFRRYPHSSSAEAALFWAGRAALCLKDYRRANDHFAALIKHFPAGHKRPEARYFQGEALCELGEYAGAILIFEDILKQYPDHSLVEAALFRKGDSQFTLGSSDVKRYEEAMASYQQVLDRPAPFPVARLQADYKIGRCLEKMGRSADAFERYMKVVYAYFKEPALRPQSNVWFARAAFNAAELKEREKSWRKASNIYRRIVDADIPASRDAAERIEQIQKKHWMSFF